MPPAARRSLLRASMWIAQGHLCHLDDGLYEGRFAVVILRHVGDVRGQLGNLHRGGGRRRDAEGGAMGTCKDPLPKRWGAGVWGRWGIADGRRILPGPRGRRRPRAAGEADFAMVLKMRRAGWLWWAPSPSSPSAGAVAS
jgi:hypothetical protein